MNDTQDLFPTRLERKLGMFERIDPVVYGDESQLADGPLSRSQIEEYEKKGFLSFESFFDADDMQALSFQKARFLNQGAKKYAPFSVFMKCPSVFNV